ncbi:MAG: hypothetical protein OXH08_12475 [Gammaproteobacteria bacterium]|nr:hypothetical protein [Gammaproteobacteria bacterium]MDE0649153.1 hypothetical protein [Gammaproteobacteria bacterium]
MPDTYPTYKEMRMPRKNSTTPLTLIAILLLAGCEVASPDIQQGVDPILAIVLLAGAFVAGWFAHRKLRGGE